jgi:hypothetical protein
MKIEVLLEVEQETMRFLRRLKAAKARIKKDTHLWGCKETAAVKRAALDLKNELTRVNESDY